jgi:hypothetical protein
VGLGSAETFSVMCAAIFVNFIEGAVEPGSHCLFSACCPIYARIETVIKNSPAWLCTGIYARFVIEEKQVTPGLKH